MSWGFICPTCGCSLVRLGVDISRAPTAEFGGEIYYFCCRECRDIFFKDPRRYVEEVRDKFVCPVCLGEKRKSEGIRVEFEGREVYLCRCPHCLEAFRTNPWYFLNRLSRGRIPPS